MPKPHHSMFIGQMLFLTPTVSKYLSVLIQSTGSLTPASSLKDVDNAQQIVAT